MHPYRAYPGRKKMKIRLLSGFSGGDDGDVRFVVVSFPELHDAVDEGEEGMVIAHTHVEAGMMACATLTDDDVACFGVLSAEKFHTQSFAFRFAAVSRTTGSFFVCHSGKY